MGVCLSPAGRGSHQVLFLLLFFLFNTVVKSVICSRSLECEDGNPKTIDLCWIPFSRCFNIAEEGENDRTFVFRSLISILEQADKTPLSIAEKSQIISSVARFVAEVNPHRFLQLNLFKVDIVKELQKFRFSLGASNTQNTSNASFHSKMTSIFQKMNDRHTTCRTPPPLRNSWASLLCNVFEFYGKDDREKTGRPRIRYVVGDVAVGHKFEHPAFGKGAEILKWNGEHIENVVLRLGQDSFGSNRAAQVLNAIALLSIRFLGFDPIPLESFIDIQFVDGNGSIHSIRTPWHFFEMKRDDIMEDMRLYVPFPKKPMAHKRKEEERPGNVGDHSFWHSDVSGGIEPVRILGQTRKRVKVKEEFEDAFRAEIVATKTGPIGHLTLPSFIPNTTAALVSELSRILGLMPQDGLVVDIRNNVGGLADYAKILSELISDKEVANQALSLRASNLILQLTQEREGNITEPEMTYMDGCLSGVETALKAGEPFTGPIRNFHTVGASGKQPQVYTGPVVTLVNGLTYSAGDHFAALQVDNNSSLLVGTSDNVGAGGASVQRYSDIAKNFASVLKPLPGGVDFTTAFFRFYRTGAKAGALVEYFGVEPKIRYYQTFNDALNADSDLFEFLGNTLASLSS